MCKIINRFFIFLAALMLLCGCASATQPSPESGSRKEIDQALTRWRELSDTSIKWLSDDGWIRVEDSPEQGDNTGMTYLQHTSWYQIADKKVVRGMAVATDPISGEDSQIFIIDQDQYRSDLIELRQKGKDAYQYAFPEKIDWGVEKVSNAALDYKNIETFKEAITNIRIEEKDNAVKFTVEYFGEPMSGKMQFYYPAMDMTGRIETYTYDTEHGNLLASEDFYVYKDGTKKQLVNMAISIEKFETVPDDVLERIELLEEENAYYRKVFEK